MQKNHLQDAYQDQSYQEGSEFLGQDYDFGVSGSDIDETDNYAPIPGGRYTLMAIKTELKDAKNGAGKRLAVEFQVVDGPRAGRKIFENYNLHHHNPQTVKIAQRQAKQWMIAAGVDPNQRLTMALFRAMEGMEFSAQVGIEAGRDGYGDLNRIKRYEAPANVSANIMRNNPPPSPAPTSRQNGGKKPWEK